MYGLMGAEVGALKLMEGSRSITCRGRQLQQRLAEALKNRFDTVEIYGDTDSSMVTGRGNLVKVLGESAEGGMTISSPAHAISIGKQMETYLNSREDGVFAHPIRVEMEKVMKMLVVHKKMYAYLQYSEGKDLFENDRSGNPLLKSKGLLPARRNTCKLSKTTFEKVVNLALSDCSHLDLLMEVSRLLRMFLLDSDLDNFTKTVEIAGSYSSATCANNVFKRNMLKLGTKIEPRSRVSFVVVITDHEASGGTSSVGSKMLLTKYFKQGKYRIDNMYYMDSYLKKSLDQVVSLAAPEFGTLLDIPGIGKVALNCPVAAVSKLASAKNATWDMSGLDLYDQMVKDMAAKLARNK